MSNTGSTTETVVSSVETVIAAAGTILSAIVPGAMIGSLTINQFVSILTGIASGVPEIVEAYNDIKAAVDGQAAPTPIQLAALKAAVDAIDDKTQTDAAKVQ